ncbi:MAG: hypothetical protein HQM02_02425 [Magnetococcales bacterium]|nr:hypothetical protein [Magnetococcales bacterium]
MARYLVRTPLRLDGQRFPPGSMLAMEPEKARELVISGVLAPDREAPPAPEDPLVAALGRLDPGEPGHWTRDGKPRIETLSQFAGRLVSARERDRLWRAREAGP